MKRDELDLLIKNGFLQSEPDEALTAEELSNLVNQGFLEELPNHFFTFHNNLTWEVIYETLLYAERRLLHSIIARHIEKYNSNNLEAVADILLYHFEKARDYPKCIHYGAKAGERASAMFAIDDAILFYSRSLTALDNINKDSPTDRSLLLEHIGDVQESHGDHKKAIDTYLLALKAWSTVSNSSDRKPKFVHWKLKPSTHQSFLLRKIAMSLEHDSEYDKSLQWLEKSEQSLPNRPGRIASLIAATRSATLYRKGEFEQAITWGKHALKKAKRSTRKEDEAYAHNMIANSCLQLGLLKDAVKHLENAESICVDIEDFPGIATASNNLGDCYYHLGDLNTAVTHYNRALTSDEQMHNQSGITMGHFNLGNILVDIGDLGKATYHLDNVIQSYNEGKCRRDLAAATYMTLSKCKRIQKQLPSAHDAIKEALQILSIDDQSRISDHANLQHAEILIAQGNVTTAKNIASKILKYAKEQKVVLLEIVAERVLGIAYKSELNFEKSLAHLKKSITLSKDIESEHEEALSIVAYTAALIDSKRVAPSDDKLIKRAIEILTKIGAKLDLAEAKRLYSQLA